MVGGEGSHQWYLVADAAAAMAVIGRPLGLQAAVMHGGLYYSMYNTDFHTNRRCVATHNGFFVSFACGL